MYIYVINYTVTAADTTPEASPNQYNIVCLFQKTTSRISFLLQIYPRLQSGLALQTSPPLPVLSSTPYEPSATRALYPQPQESLPSQPSRAPSPQTSTQPSQYPSSATQSLHPGTPIGTTMTPTSVLRDGHLLGCSHPRSPRPLEGEPFHRPANSIHRANPGVSPSGSSLKVE